MDFRHESERVPTWVFQGHTFVVPPKKLLRQEGFFMLGLPILMLKTTTIIFLIALSVLAVLHLIALSLYLYWQVWWFDIPMHLLGGASIVLGLHTLADLRMAPRSLATSLGNVLLIVLGIAIAWEMFQYAVTEVLKHNYISDTLGDIAVGLLGSLVGYTISTRLQDSQMN